MDVSDSQFTSACKPPETISIAYTRNRHDRNELCLILTTIAGWLLVWLAINRLELLLSSVLAIFALAFIIFLGHLSLSSISAIRGIPVHGLFCLTGPWLSYTERDSSGNVVEEARLPVATIEKVDILITPHEVSLEVVMPDEKIQINLGELPDGELRLSKLLTSAGISFSFKR